MLERNAGLPPERRIEFRVGIHLGDVVEESDGDLMGDGVNIAARLEGVAEPGGICLSSAAYEQVRDKVKDGFVDLGEKELKNIARPVRAYAVKSNAGNSRSDSPAEQKPSAPRLSIVVLPFANIGGGPKQDYFVDGVTESLTTDLSRIRGSFVIARNTAFTYKGKSVDVKLIGRELSVRYVLEGSVQRGGGRMRINVQLVDAESGNHLWAERFDKPVVDLFDMQDEIVARLANALNTQLITAEARRAERAPSPDSMDLHFQGMSWYNKTLHPDYLSRAQDLFERALALDPSNVEALIGAGLVNGAFASSIPPTAASLAWPRPKRSRSKRCRSRLRMRWGTSVWAVLRCTSTGPRRASPSWSEHWRSTAIWRPPMGTSVWSSVLPAALRILKFTFRRPFDSVP
jgi:TolB-like protein